MKNGQNLRELQQQKAKKTEEQWIHQPVCMVCKKACEGYYARRKDSGTCSSKCMKIQEKEYPYGEHTEEAFLKRLEEQSASPS